METHLTLTNMKIIRPLYILLFNTEFYEYVLNLSERHEHVLYPKFPSCTCHVMPFYIKKHEACENIGNYKTHFFSVVIPKMSHK